VGAIYFETGQNQPTVTYLTKHLRTYWNEEDKIVLLLTAFVYPEENRAGVVRWSSIIGYYKGHYPLEITHEVYK